MRTKNSIALPPIALALISTFLTIENSDAATWPMRQRDIWNTGRADFSVASNRVNQTFFDALRWQKRTPGSPGEGNLRSGTMSFFDGVGPGGSNLVVGTYGWPKGIQGMDRHTGKLFWYGLPDGGESISTITPAFSGDGLTIYIANDATAHPLMAMPSLVGPSQYWHNGGDAQAELFGAFSLKVDPQGRVYSHQWDRFPQGATDYGTSLSLTWQASRSLCECLSGPAILSETGRVSVISGGRCGRVSAFDGQTGSEQWFVETGQYTDADPTIDPATGNIYLPVGEGSLYVVGLTRNGQPLWNLATMPVYPFTAGLNQAQRAESAGCLAHDGLTFYFQSVSEQGDGRLFAVRTVDGGVKWSLSTQSKGGQDFASSPIVTLNGVIIVGNNGGGTYYAIRDDGNRGTVLDTLKVDTNGTAQASATLSPDGLLYLPARLTWVQGNGDGETPSQQIENLFNSFDLNAVVGWLPPPTGLRGHAVEQMVELFWDSVADPLDLFDHYAVYRETQPFNSVTGRTPMATLSNRFAGSFQDTNGMSGTRYYYLVTSVSKAGLEEGTFESIGPLLPGAMKWPGRQRDIWNTGRADFIVPSNRLNQTFFDAIRWQKRAPGSPDTGGIGASGMPFFDGAGPGGSDVVVGTYHWPKGVQGMDRRTGKLFWSGLPDGGETIGDCMPGFSNDGRVLYLANDATSHPLMAMRPTVGPSEYWHNGGDARPDLVMTLAPKIAPDGRVFVMGPRAETDFGTTLGLTWSAAEVGLCAFFGGPALWSEAGQLRVVGSGRCGRVSTFDGQTGAEQWFVETYQPADAEPTIDPVSGNIYLPVGEGSLYVAGFTSRGEPLWGTASKQVYQYTPGVNTMQWAETTGCLAHDGATFYFQSVSQEGDGRLYALRTIDGSVKWSFETHSKSWKVMGASPIVTANGVIVVGNNEGGAYYAIRDDTDHGTQLDVLNVGVNGTARATATLSQDGLLYLPARLTWVQGNGDNEAPSQQTENLFNAFDLNAAPEVTLPSPSFLRGRPLNNAVQLFWQPAADSFGLFVGYIVYRSTQPIISLAGVTELAMVTNRLATGFLDTTATNGVRYYYAVTTRSSGGRESALGRSLGPFTPYDETDLQVVCVSRSPWFPRFDALYTYYELTEPSGFGPYGFSSATGLGSGQTADTPRWPKIGETVTYTATVRNRGSNPWTNAVHGAWEWDGKEILQQTVSGPLLQGGTMPFALARDWDGQVHSIRFVIAESDSRSENNSLTLGTKSVPFLSYVDVSYYEDFRSHTTAWTNAATDDFIDWLNRNMGRFNQLFAQAGSSKRVHYDVLELLDDSAPDPPADQGGARPWAIFPFRYRAGVPDWRLNALALQPADDIEYALLHEMGHQLGLIDIYQFSLPPDNNLVSGRGYWPGIDLMYRIDPMLSPHSALAMNHWLHQAHGYYGQYLYGIPTQVGLRLTDTNGLPLSAATLRMFQMCYRPGQGVLITPQVKAQGTTDTNGVWMLPNVPIDPAKVPPLPTGDVLHDNPFGYVAVVGNNGLLHFQIEWVGQTNFAWLDIMEVNTAYYRGRTDTALFDRQVSPSGLATKWLPMNAATMAVTNSAFDLRLWECSPYPPIVFEGSSDLRAWTPVWTNYGDAGVPMEMSDPVGTNSSRFYRAKQ